MGFLTKERILAVDDIVTEDVDVPEWGGTVRVRGLSGVERDAFEASMIERRGKKVETNLTNLRAKLVAASVVDEKGSRLFSDADVKALGAKSAAGLDRVYDVAQRLSGISDDDVDELAGNLSGTASGDSSST